jgi:hypothetical protein
VVSSLFAVSDLHVGSAENRSRVDALMTESPRDWLIVAGAVAELCADVERTLRQLRDRFTAVISVPGNHEWWNLPKDRVVRLRGDIPGTTEDDGGPFREVSLGYPREWRRPGTPPRLLTPVLP